MEQIDIVDFSITWCGSKIVGLQMNNTIIWNDRGDNLTEPVSETKFCMPILRATYLSLILIQGLAIKDIDVFASMLNDKLSGIQRLTGLLKTFVTNKE